MHTMLKTKGLLAALFVTCFVPGFADSQANVPYSTHAEGFSLKTYNLQGHEKRINAYHDKMTKHGKVHELSQEFITVHSGMKKGGYTYNHATTRKVLQEVYAKRIPAKGLQHRVETQTKK